MKLAALTSPLLTTLSEWMNGNKPIVLEFVPDSGSLQVYVNRKHVGRLWLEEGELHAETLKLVQISRVELRRLINEIDFAMARETKP